MKTLGRIFLSGLAAVVPIALTFALLAWLGLYAERVLGAISEWLLPDTLAFPGLGLLLGVALVFGVGVLMQVWIVRRLFDLSERLLEHIPLIKTIYGSIRDVMQMFSPHDGQDTGRPVLVRVPGRSEAVLGFLTRDGLGDALGGEDMVAVYLPMSYQIGGFTLVIPRGQVEPVDMGAQDAMRFVLTAGMGVSERGSNGANQGEHYER
ncbi:DUF502 domain-containing protein [Arhodomonas aquaeolei]|uniref:DUF502 domain-containing protein n=1 Tax=Arhodomonas aquaeolei TaxID=2369 RepID=UPI0021698598|nr:DUF502 domain-containing protein [Arhodomonas aquaeolei]MCS4505212.1 DUF502 domain-containing protein [Arhodomonas aquaeolei]